MPAGGTALAVAALPAGGPGCGAKGCKTTAAAMPAGGTALAVAALPAGGPGCGAFGLSRPGPAAWALATIAAWAGDCGGVAEAGAERVELHAAHEVGLHGSCFGMHGGCLNFTHFFGLHGGCLIFTHFLGLHAAVVASVDGPGGCEAGCGASAIAAWASRALATAIAAWA